MRYTPRAFWITEFIFFSLFDTAFVSSGCQLSSTSTITIPHLEQTCLLEFDRYHGPLPLLLSLSLSFFSFPSFFRSRNTVSQPTTTSQQCIAKTMNYSAPRWSLISAHRHCPMLSELQPSNLALQPLSINFNLWTWTFNSQPPGPCLTFRISASNSTHEHQPSNSISSLGYVVPRLGIQLPVHPAQPPAHPSTSNPTLSEQRRTGITKRASRYM
jgi:hypothetical protein